MYVYGLCSCCESIMSDGKCFVDKISKSFIVNTVNNVVNVAAILQTLQYSSVLTFMLQSVGQWTNAAQ